MVRLMGLWAAEKNRKRLVSIFEGELWVWTGTDLHGQPQGGQAATKEEIVHTKPQSRKDKQPFRPDHPDPDDLGFRFAQYPGLTAHWQDLRKGKFGFDVTAGLTADGRR